MKAEKTNRLLLLGWLLTVGAAGEAFAAVDVWVKEVHVTQATQSPDGDVPLVAGRTTAIRALVVMDGRPASPPAVVGRLHIYDGTTRRTSAVGLRPRNEERTPATDFIPPPNPSLEREGDTLNFELTPINPLPASDNLTFEVEMKPVDGETNTANNSRRSRSFRVLSRLTPLIRYVPIDYLPAGTGLPSPGLIGRGVGDVFVRGILPVWDHQLLDQYLPSPGLPLSFNEDPNGNRRIDGLEGSLLLSRLASYRHLIVANDRGGEDTRFLYGWLNGNPTGESGVEPDNGLAPTPGRLGFGNTEEARYQRTFAHELMHNLGFEDATSERTEAVGWESGVFPRLAGNPPGNGVVGQVKARDLFDLMVPGRRTNEAWISPGLFKDLLLDHKTLSDSRAVPEPTPRALVIHGVFDPTGQRIEYLKPVFRYPWLTGQTYAYNQANFFPFTALITDQFEEKREIKFTARVAADKAREGRRYGFFEIIAPLEANVMKLEFFGPNGQVQIKNWKGAWVNSVDASPNAPIVNIYTPEVGASLEESTTTVGWEGTDEDTPPEALMYQVIYSPDEGESWLPIAVDLHLSPDWTQTQVTFPTRLLPRSDSGWIRVIASDGLNTTIAGVRGLFVP